MADLKTDYQDDMFTGLRKYIEVDNGDGTISFEDQTEYEQRGDSFGGGDINSTNKAIMGMRDVITATLTTSNWSGSSAPYSQDVAVSGMTDEMVFDVGIMFPSNCSRSNQKSINKAYSYIFQAESGDGVVTFRATEKPTVDIPIGIKGVV